MFYWFLQIVLLLTFSIDWLHLLLALPFLMLANGAKQVGLVALQWHSLIIHPVISFFLGGILRLPMYSI